MSDKSTGINERNMAKVLRQREWRQLENLRESAVRDPLTGAYNRRFLEEKANEMVKTGTPFALVIFDLDHFKEFNDNYGHNVGDAVLRLFVIVTEGAVKSARPEGMEDLIVRYGGEEFVVLLRGITDLEKAKEISERIRNQLASEEIKFKNLENERQDTVKVTVSGGVAVFRNGDDLETVIERADKALYVAKNFGRNNIKTEKDVA